MKLERLKLISTILGTILSITFFAVAIYGSVNAHTQPMAVNHDYIPYEMETERIMVELPAEPDYAKPVIDRYNPYVFWTEREKDLLVQIAQSEAGNQGTIGMALVMRVVLNRVEKNGTDIETEIFKPGQFATKGMARGTWETYEALDMVQMGWDESQGAIFFCSEGYNACGSEPLFRYGDHWFSR